MGRVFCSSDWHGCWDPAYKVIEYLKPDDKLYFLGDAIDRGEDGIKIFQMLINDPRVTFIKGNHEDMMARAIPFIYAEIEDPAESWFDTARIIQNWYNNGGLKTAQTFYDMTKKEVFAIRTIINKMPTECVYHSPKGHNVILEHAGYTPFNIPHRSHDPLWDREHFKDSWFGGYELSNLKPSNTYLVHGHTPVHYLKYEYGYNGKTSMTKEDMIEKRKFMKGEPIKYKPEIIRYCDGHKFCIDMCTVYSDRIALLDLDTFETIYFDKEN